MPRKISPEQKRWLAIFGFNEAGAEMPRKIVHLRHRRKRQQRFNEAGAEMPRKIFVADQSIGHAVRLQ